MKPASMWLPFTPIDQLLFVLDQHQKDPYYHKVCGILLYMYFIGGVKVYKQKTRLDNYLL